jgi:hypothetical protein
MRNVFWRRPARETTGTITKIHEIIAHRPSDTSPKFTIDVAGDQFAENPDHSMIASAVHAATMNEPDHFVILYRLQSGEFIQAAVIKDSATWDLEFGALQGGTTPVLFRCINPVSTEMVIQAMQNYIDDDDEWMKVCEWAPLKF